MISLFASEWTSERSSPYTSLKRPCASTLLSPLRFQVLFCLFSSSSSAPRRAQGYITPFPSSFNVINSWPLRVALPDYSISPTAEHAVPQSGFPCQNLRPTDLRDSPTSPERAVQTISNLTLGYGIFTNEKKSTRHMYFSGN